MFTKYPKTNHLPSSPGLTNDDRVLSDVSAMFSSPVVVTEKMDGENTTLYKTGLHARSLNNSPHPSRSWVKGFQSSVSASIPDGWRVCGENMFARHSISYCSLESYFLAFSVWDENNVCLSWSDTKTFCQTAGISLVPVLAEGMLTEAAVQKLVSQIDTEKTEGVVVRRASEFSFTEFSSVVAKWVRPTHVQTDEQWMHKNVVPNLLR